MPELRFYSLAAAFGDPDTSRVETVLAGVQVAQSPEMAAAQFISTYYADGAPKHLVIGLTLHAMPENDLVRALDMIRQAREADKATSKVVQIVPPVAHASPLTTEYAHGNPFQSSPADDPA